MKTIITVILMTMILSCQKEIIEPIEVKTKSYTFTTCRPIDQPWSEIISVLCKVDGEHVSIDSAVTIREGQTINIVVNCLSPVYIKVWVDSAPFEVYDSHFDVNRWVIDESFEH